MNLAVQRFPARLVFALLTVVPIAILFVLVLLAPPDGNERSEWLQFFGRFHPIAVHLPVAVLMLVPLVELAGRSRYFPNLLSAVDFLLGVAICGAIGAVALGWCLARSGSYSGPLVTQHMWGGMFVASASWLCWFARARGTASRGNPPYAILLLATVGLVVFTGYRGGQLSQGPNHLTEHMPQQLRSWLGIQAFASVSSNSTNGGPNTFYGARIQPIFAEHCVSCHGESKHKAKLRLDSYDAVMRGGKDGPVIQLGKPQSSELFHRVTLPPSDDDFMPAEHKPPLSLNEIKRLELWISNGASGTESDQGSPDEVAAAAPVAEVSFEEIDPATVAKQRAALASFVAQLQQRFPSLLEYESRGSANLVVDASLRGSTFGDDDLGALAPIAGQIVIADLSNTVITDKSSSTIASMTRLRSLRLVNTKITDTAVKALTPLSQLESLNLFGTAVTADAITAVGQLPKLTHVYVHGTKISSGAPMPEQLKQKIIF